MVPTQRTGNNGSLDSKCPEGRFEYDSHPPDPQDSLDVEDWKDFKIDWKDLKIGKISRLERSQDWNDSKIERIPRLKGSQEYFQDWNDSKIERIPKILKTWKDSKTWKN